MLISITDNLGLRAEDLGLGTEDLGLGNRTGDLGLGTWRYQKNGDLVLSPIPCYPFDLRLL